MIDWSTFLHRLTPMVLSLSSKIRSRLSFSTLCFLRRRAKATRSDCSMVLGIPSRPNTHSQRGGLRSKPSGNQDDSQQLQKLCWGHLSGVGGFLSPCYCVTPPWYSQRKTGDSLPLDSQAIRGPLYLRIRLWSSGFDSILRDSIVKMRPEWFNLLKGEKKSNWSMKAINVFERRK